MSRKNKKAASPAADEVNPPAVLETPEQTPADPVPAEPTPATPAPAQLPGADPDAKADVDPGDGEDAKSDEPAAAGVDAVVDAGVDVPEPEPIVIDEATPAEKANRELGRMMEAMAQATEEPTGYRSMRPDVKLTAEQAGTGAKLSRILDCDPKQVYGRLLDLIALSAQG